MTVRCLVGGHDWLVASVNGRYVMQCSRCGATRPIWGLA